MVRNIGLSIAASALIAAGLLMVGDVHAAQPAAVAAPAVPAQWVNILSLDGSAADAAEWKIAAPGATLGGTPQQETLLGAGKQYLTIDRKAGIAGPSEWVVSFRMKPTKTTGGSCLLAMTSVAQDGKPAQTLNLSASIAAATPYLSYSASVAGTKTPPPVVSGYLYLVPVTERSLAWSEEMRAAIESQIASVPKADEILYTLRAVVEDTRMRAWVNGRYIGELALEPGVNRAGPVRVQVAPGAELVSLRARSYAPVESSNRFEPLSIAGSLNGSTLMGERIDPASLPAAEGVYSATTTIGGVPFEFPRPAATPGREDHIDVGQSWTRFGAISGYIAGNFGTFGGRWISADRLDPSRICMYVPKGRYKALHLIAASEDRPDTTPIVTAQFYRPDAGHPVNFPGRVPSALSAGSSTSIPVTLANGKPGKLHHVTIPLDPDAFSWFTDLPRIALEITKQVQYYRAYPDPLEYSYHGAGLPSSVQIYAMTLERASVDVDIVPENYGHVWTAPATPNYSIELTNRTGKATSGTVIVSTKSEDGIDHSRQVLKVDLPADTSVVKVPVTLSPKRYGLHQVTVSCTADGQSANFKRNLAYFHPDTRDKEVWHEGRGPIFGYWPWGGGHTTPTADKEIAVMAAAGAETSTANYSRSAPEIRALAEKHRFISEAAFTGGIMYFNGFYQWYTGAPKWDPANPEASGKALIEAMKKEKCEPSVISRPTYVPFFAEPQMGNITTGIWPTHYGEEYTLNADEKRVFEDMKAKYLAGARAIRKEWPDLKLLVPYGDPMNAAIFLRLAPETRDLIDGCALDLPAFERLPEQQVNQVVLNRLYPILKDIKQYKPNPYLMLIEGTCTSSKDIDTLERGQSDYSIRNFLVLLGYGFDRLESCNAPFDCANYWGENHYGAGWMTRLPLAMPKPAYVQYATLTRHVNRKNFSKYVPTGSTSTFCQQHKHYKTGELTHVLWTIRGKRVVHVKVPAGGTLSLYDPNDNVTELTEKNGYVTFTIDSSPRYLEGLTADPEIKLGDSDHTDSLPVMASKLGNFADGSWTLVAKGDQEYQKNKPQQIERFLGNMTASTVDAPSNQGGKALAIKLLQQEKDRGVMPYFTTLEPKEPITIPGKASHLGVWVRASSDWGRIVYTLRDAKGEKWISVGTKEDWNNDDIHGWSHFCFDGWRYLKFETPASAPYDSFREYGTSWWGSYGGDGVVDLPLKLEKVIVERRNKAVYGNDLVPVKDEDVLLGDIYAQYAKPADQTEETVRLSQVRMPVPTNIPAMENPIAELAKNGVGAPTKIIRVTDPSHQYDGTRCHVAFDPVPGATSYDVWVAPYKDGTGAMKLGAAWKEPGQLIQGLRPDRQFYAFVVYTDKDGKLSKPSAPLAFTLVDRFGYK